MKLYFLIIAYVAFARAEYATISGKIGKAPKITAVVPNDGEYCLKLIDIGGM